MRLLPAVLFALSLGAGATTAQSSPAAYSAAVADARRPAADRDRDAARLPAQVLAFARIKPSEKVGDFMMGGGYFTRLLAAEVGPTGKTLLPLTVHGAGREAMLAASGASDHPH